ncbi:unnamed protein product [Durusdinium trenchii]|uniref:EGF-like domain-containing protein n=1 Tax=Durusdinium trenchii TaxID=1381693 RepID=A0ABP0LYU2_9DINO
MQRICWLWCFWCPSALALNTWCQLRENDSCKGQRHLLFDRWKSPSSQGCPWHQPKDFGFGDFSGLVDFADWDTDGYIDVLEARGHGMRHEIVWFQQHAGRPRDTRHPRDSRRPIFSKKVSLMNWTAQIDGFTVADWNKDGFNDLLICSEHAVLFMMNGEDGLLSSGEIARNISSCKFVKAIDFDLDGDLDLIVDHKYFERISDVQVEERQGAANPLQIVENGQLWAVEDWDNDGDLDLLVERLVGDGQGYAFIYLEQLSDGSFREPRENPFHGLSSIESRYIGLTRNHLADLNGDGSLDLWQMGSFSDCNYVYELAHVRDEVLVEHTVSENPTHPFVDLDMLGDEVHLVDWNQDGLMDLILSRAHCNGVDAWDLVAFSLRRGQACYAHRNAPAIRYFQGQDDGSLKETFGVFDHIDPEPYNKDVWTPEPGGKYRISLADWDQDGDLDLILISGSNISFYQNQEGHLTWTDSALSHVPGMEVRFTDEDNAVTYLPELKGVSSQPIALDWDGDALTDLILAPEGRVFRRTRHDALEELSREENPFRTLPPTTATDLQWRLVDCDGDGDLDLIRLNRSQRLEACERKGDSFNCSSRFKCLEWEQGRPQIYSFDLWMEGNGHLSLLGTPVSPQRRAKFWSQGFCLPSQQCNGKGQCRNLQGICQCIRGHDLDDCSGCQVGFASDGDGCQACAADDRGETCSGRGICRDDRFARHQLNISNSTRLLARGDGSCLCNEETFGGMDVTGKVNCASGRCPDGFEEVRTAEVASAHCQACAAGSSSVDGAPCSPCLPGSAAGIGRATCESCAAGHFSATVGNSECLVCHAGSYAAAGSNMCGQCPPGTYSTIGASNCTWCPNGWVAEGASPTCEPCLAGTYAHEGRFCRNCPSNTISTSGRSECEPCVGFFLVAYADTQRLTCQASMLNLFFAVATCLCLTVTLLLALWLCFYQLHIEDLSLQGDGLVVTTSRPHRILHWSSEASITLRNTGSPPLECLQTRGSFRAQALSGRDLKLIHPESVGTWDTSIGYLHVHIPAALLRTGFLRIPSVLWLILLLAAVVLLARQLLLHMTPLVSRRRRFREELVKLRGTVLSRCPSGPERAVTIGQLGWLCEFFLSFIKDRSMYYICSNLVTPLTEDCKLSYAELVGPKRVHWFVSHYWGTPFQEFVAAVRHHAKSDGAVEWQSTAYWVCTFSNNQWQVEAELGHGLWQESSFYKSLRSDTCQGTVMVLDEQAQPLRRAWCLFEILQTQLRSADRGSSFQGLLLCTSSGVLRNGQGGIEIAMKVANCLASLDLKDAKASDAKDEAMIRSLVEHMPGGFHATNSFVRRSIRDCLLVTHKNFEVDFGRLLTILNSSLLAEDDAQGHLPTLLPKPIAHAAPEGKKDHSSGSTN